MAGVLKVIPFHDHHDELRHFYGLGGFTAKIPEPLCYASVEEGQLTACGRVADRALCPQYGKW